MSLFCESQQEDVCLPHGEPWGSPHCLHCRIRCTSRFGEDCPAIHRPKLPRMHVHTASCFGENPVATYSATAGLPEEATAVPSVKVSRREKPNLFIKKQRLCPRRNRGSIRTKPGFSGQTEAYSVKKKLRPTERTATKIKQKPFSSIHRSIRKRKKPRRNRNITKKSRNHFSKIHRICSVKKNHTGTQRS